MTSKGEGSHQIRIIGGKWRGRLLSVVAHATLRPTPDRVRETLFNWLMKEIHGARCLDLFAGTGALGFEALSRGAREVVFVESHLPALKAIQNTADQLQAKTACEIIHSDALAWLARSAPNVIPFDIIFLDPPFSSELLTRSLAMLSTSPLVGPHTFIYVEAPVPFSAEHFPSMWQCLKQKTAGKVAYSLLQGSIL